MPGSLPSNVGYTYAVELSVDEALAAGAERVELSTPIPFYVENFLDFPVNDPVPVGRPRNQFRGTDFVRSTAPRNKFRGYPCLVPSGRPEKAPLSQPTRSRQGGLAKNLVGDGGTQRHGMNSEAGTPPAAQVLPPAKAARKKCRAAPLGARPR